MAIVVSRWLKPFSYLYDEMLAWSRHPKAPFYLAGVAFVESSFFPIPPDVMLISMGLTLPHRSWHFALIATFFSVLGGMLGYTIGFYAMHWIEPYLLDSVYALSYQKIKHWFEFYGVWMVVLAGFTPIPYKLFTITAGALNMAMLPFMLGSVVGRGLRFFMVSGILYYFGAKIEPQLRTWVDKIGWMLLFTILVVYGVLKWGF